MADSEAWTADRSRTVRAAMDAVLKAAEKRGEGRAHASGRAQEAAVKAGREYERSHPLPLWRDTDTRNATLMYTEDERPSLLQRAGAALGVL